MPIKYNPEKQPYLHYLVEEKGKLTGHEKEEAYRLLLDRVIATRAICPLSQSRDCSVRADYRGINEFPDSEYQVFEYNLICKSLAKACLVQTNTHDTL
jgi:hypothetical protein